MNPRVPGNAIGDDPATQELLWDFRQTHIEVTTKELNVMAIDFRGKPIKEFFPCRLPSDFHGAMVSMHTEENDIPAQVPNVLFEADAADDRSRYRMLCFSFVFVRDIDVTVVLEQLEGVGGVLVRRNQHSIFRMFASHHVIVFKWVSTNKTCLAVSFPWRLHQQLRDCGICFAQDQHVVRWGFADSVIVDVAASASPLRCWAAQSASRPQIANVHAKVAYLWVGVPYGTFSATAGFSMYWLLGRNP